MLISNELIDQLLQDCHSPQDLLGESGLLKVLTKRLAERVLEAEMDMHLGYAKHEPAGNHSGAPFPLETQQNGRGLCHQ